MTFDLQHIPFSRRGSWLGFSLLSEAQTKHRGVKPGLYLRTMQGAITGGREVFRISLLRRKREIPFRAVGSPGVLRLITDRRGTVEAAFASTNRVLLRGMDCGLAFEADPICFATLRAAGEGRWEANLMAQRIQLMLSLFKGRCRIAAPWKGSHCEKLRIEILPDDDGRWEIALEEFFTAWKEPSADCGFDQAIQDSNLEYLEWLNSAPVVPERWKSTRELAAYIQWMSLVAPRGFLGRETMLMSKNWMTNVWSWDHCFNAIALLPADPQLAWDQWAVPFDLQNEFGALPDCANNADVVWNFCKPPIHGWALGRMRARGLRLTKSRQAKACHWLEKWTSWWLNYRDEDHDGLPQYNHGNDSGWDNATCFGAGMPVEGPDLAAFLILQMEEIARMRKSLGDHKTAQQWTKRSESLLSKLLAHSWREDRFVAPRSGDHFVAEGDSLIPLMPLLLAKRLPPKQRACILTNLKRFLTPYGLATENPDSPFYRADGYWRGPVWAPTTYLMVDALLACGEAPMAVDIARRFCRACAKGGLAENFNALTGEGLRDRAYSWTASVFFLLAPLVLNAEASLQKKLLG